MSATGLAWVALPALPQGLSARVGRLDAYLVWDLLTDFQRHAALAATAASPGPAPAERWLPLVAELAAPADKSLAAMAAGSPRTGLPTLAARLTRWAGPAGLSPLQTGIVPERLIKALAAAVANGQLTRFQLGAPCAQPLAAKPQPLPERPAWLPAAALHTLGVIDDGCCLAHQDFRGPPGQSRLLWLWDQTPQAQPGTHWQRHAAPDGPQGFAPPYGMELCNARIGLLLQDPHCGQLGEAGERRLYAAIDRPDWGPPDHSHGARVLHLLAGPQRPPDGPAAAPAATLLADAATLPIIFVQLPAQTIADTSGDSLAMHVIDAARYVVGRTRDACLGEQAWATTLNISLGGIAGPHDGSSLAELALDELAADARVQVVVSAGNAADRQRIHAQRSVSQAQPGDFFIDLPAGQRQHSFIEFWLPDAGDAAAAWQIELRPPGADAPVALVQAGQVLCLRADGGPPLASLVFAHQVAQGLHGTMVLLALAPTSPTPGAAAATAHGLAPAGVWQVQVRTQVQSPAEVHAWVERDDVLIGERRPQRTRFELDPRQPLQAQYVNDSCTLSTLAHGQRVVAAGALVLSSHAMAPYSSRGPCRGQPAREVTLHYAAGDRSPSQPGVLVPGFFSGQVASLGGTSAAAPQVARRLVETGSALAVDAPAMTDPDGRPWPPRPSV